jgi:hypothetical protein
MTATKPLSTAKEKYAPFLDSLEEKLPSRIFTVRSDAIDFSHCSQGVIPSGS